jgi:hypothetical protein
MDNQAERSEPAPTPLGLTCSTDAKIRQMPSTPDGVGVGLGFARDGTSTKTSSPIWENRQKDYLLTGKITMETTSHPIADGPTPRSSGTTREELS